MLATNSGHPYFPFSYMQISYETFQLLQKNATVNSLKNLFSFINEILVGDF